MSVPDYMNLPYDLSGSMAKNRFRIEMLWGLKKVLELLKNNNEFIILFDYKCDIEIHLPNSNFEFYQLKTSNTGNYTINKLLKKNDVGQSVLGKLYLLKYDRSGVEQDEIKLAIVSNVALKDTTKLHTNLESVLLKSIDGNDVTKIKNDVTKELSQQSEIKLENTFFIKTTIDLTNPNETLMGELASFFVSFYDCEVKRLRSLFSTLQTIITDKASYEFELLTYDDLIIKKGVTKKDFEKIFQSHMDNSDTALEKSSAYIESEYKAFFGMRVKLSKALKQVFFSLKISKPLQLIENKIAKFILENIHYLNGTDKEIIGFISERFMNEKPLEVENQEFEMLILLILKKFEEGLYEQLNH
ncbi:dsDNA nuclease domain-containing protein [Paenibacillus xylanexedens]|uniref:dsDNA nuclease domain-containing protein n=1 Tax=Paenibacillus xylanexedens TaxID=528191 RepID=UPI000AA97779|nr:dsDNA nuclease domain-containing protein [Paenibacillus xylanexedens]